jgi:DNA-binding IscR family transcriptional regulator
MSRSTRFPVAVHILAVLAIKPDGYIGSELIAKSVATNAVVVRRMISLLSKAGFVECQAGAGGGARLCVDPKTVTLQGRPLYRERTHPHGEVRH